MDRFWFGVITGFALASVIEADWPVWKEAMVIVPLCLFAYFIACKLLEK